MVSGLLWLLCARTPLLRERYERAHQLQDLVEQPSGRMKLLCIIIVKERAQFSCQHTEVVVDNGITGLMTATARTTARKSGTGLPLGLKHGGKSCNYLPCHAYVQLPTRIPAGPGRGHSLVASAQAASDVNSDIL